MDLGKLGENLRDFRLKGGTFWTEVLGRKMVLRNLACALHLSDRRYGSLGHVFRVKIAPGANARAER